MKCIDDVCPRYQLKNIQQIDANLFLVVGTLKTGRMAKTNKNMIVVRHNKRELTLINPIRLEDEGETSLLRFGAIQRLIRLAPRQGIEHDKYYLQKFPNIRRWAPEMSDDPRLPVHRLFTAEDTCILPACHVFCFQEAAQPECAVVVQQEHGGNILVTAECAQAHQNNPYINIPARAQLAVRGLTARDIVIPPTWLKSMQTKNRGALRNDFEALLRLDFERLVGASGVMLNQKAKEKMVLAVEHDLPMW